MNWLVSLIRKEVNTHFTRHDEPIPPEGYQPLEVIRRGLYHWVLVPFFGHEVWCKLRCLNSTQINACGGVTLIDLMKNANGEKLSFDKLIDIRNIQEKLIRETLVEPTFQEIETFIFNEDEAMKKYRDELNEISKIDMSSMSDDEKADIKGRIERAKLYTSFPMPEDAFAFLTSWALGIDRSDIKKITEDMLLEAAVLATRGNDNPSNHISGIRMTDRDEPDINKTAWLVYGDFMHKREVEQNAMKGINRVGGRRNSI